MNSVNDESLGSPEASPASVFLDGRIASIHLPGAPEPGVFLSEEEEDDDGVTDGGTSDCDLCDPTDGCPEED